MESSLYCLLKLTMGGPPRSDGNYTQVTLCLYSHVGFILKIHLSPLNWNFVFSKSRLSLIQYSYRTEKKSPSHQFQLETDHSSLGNTPSLNQSPYFCQSPAWVVCQSGSWRMERLWLDHRTILCLEWGSSFQSSRVLFEAGETIHVYIFILIFKNVYISMRSKSLGALVLYLTENHKSERQPRHF